MCSHGASNQTDQGNGVAAGGRSPASCGGAAWRRPGSAIVCLLLTLVVTAGAARAEFVFAASLQSQSPAGDRVEVNGVCIPSEGATASWWYYDWGDGSVTTGFFPATHRYREPGEYSIHLRAFDDLGQSADWWLPCFIPLPPESFVREVTLARTLLGLKVDQARVVRFGAYDEDGLLVSLEGLAVETYVPIPGVIDVAVVDNSLQITALDPGSWDTSRAYVYLYVDGVECDQPLVVIVNRNAGDFATVAGEHSAFYLPVAFFDEALMSEADHAQVLDLAYSEFDWAVAHDDAWKAGPLVQSVSYVPPVCGVNGDPLSLGDAALPYEGVPHLDVVFHEMGHNFQSYRMLCLGSGGASGPLYQETLAEWHVQFACHRLLDLHSSELSLAARACLAWLRDSNRGYHEWEYDNYINGGMQFDFGSIMPSHVLVQRIYELCDTYGWDHLRDFYGHFDAARMAALSQVYGSFGGANDVYRLSALVAALGLTFGEDLTTVFLSLNFPIDVAFHDAAWAALGGPAADLDGDGDVDHGDLGVFVGCMTGPDLAPSPECEPADLGADADVDLADFADLQAACNGS